MQPAIKQVAVNLSQLIPVKWDRYTVFNGYFNLYGWIERTDGQRDFVLLQLYHNGASIQGGFVTSSAKYSKQIGEFIFGEGAHADCIKFEPDTIPTFDEGVEDAESLKQQDRFIKTTDGVEIRDARQLVYSVADNFEILFSHAFAVPIIEGRTFSTKEAAEKYIHEKQRH